MSYRFMRVIVFFDLPVVTTDDMREYRKFRKYLIKNGFIMVQESVYVKLTANSNTADAVSDNLRKNKPPNGLVQVLKVTEKQYNRMECIVGECKSDIIDTDERLIIL